MFQRFLKEHPSETATSKTPKISSSSLNSKGSGEFLV
jgi:hypothetical protein